MGLPSKRRNHNVVAIYNCSIRLDIFFCYLDTLPYVWTVCLTPLTKFENAPIKSYAQK